MRVSAKRHMVSPEGFGFHCHTFGFSTVCTILSVIVASLVFHFTIAITVDWASGSAAVIVVTVSVIAATIVLAWGVVSTTRRGRSGASTWWSTITATSV